MSAQHGGSQDVPPVPGLGREGHPPADETDEGGVPGERGIPPVQRVRSVQSRVSSILTVTLLGGLATALLIWYYAGAVNRSGRAQQLAVAAAKRRAQGDSALPSLGAIVPPKVNGSESPSVLEHLLTPPPPPLPEVVVTQSTSAAPSGPPKKTPAELDWERRLGGPVLSARSSDRNGPPASGYANDPADLTAQSGEAARTQPTGRDESDTGADGESLQSLLRPTSTPAVRARVLPTQRFLLAKGAFIDCTLETAVSSGLPGMTTCVTATDTFSADGTVVLLERGSKLVGETRGQVQQGKPRLFVLWTEARTPHGVVVPLASPGTDELGRSGLSGDIDYHWWKRFGTALLITVVDATVQGLTEKTAGSTVIINPSTSSQVATEVLRDTVHIPPTIEKAQGDRIQILVARDVDFRSVYTLTAVRAP
jgi:type IV secretion system protein VirB10